MPAKRGNKAAFLAAFKSTGEISKASKIAGTRRELHYRRMENDPEYKAAFTAICAEIASKRAAHAQSKATPSLEADLRSEIGRLNARISELGKEFRRKLKAMEARLTQPAVQRAVRPKEGDELLDQIARGMAKKPFSRLTPAHQDAVRDIAKRMRGDQPD